MSQSGGYGGYGPAAPYGHVPPYGYGPGGIGSGAGGVGGAGPPSPGELYDPASTAWPEVTQLRLSAAGAELAVFTPSPGDAVADLVAHGSVTLGLVPASRWLLLIARFGGGNRSSVVCTARWELHRQADVPAMLPGSPVSPVPVRLDVVLVDASGGRVRAVRTTELPGPMAQALHEAVARQRAAPPDLRTAARELDDLFAHVGPSELLDGAPHRCLLR